MGLAYEAIKDKVQSPIPHLEVLRIFVELGDDRLEDSLVAALSRLRAYFPVDVDEFLEDPRITNILKRRVKTSAVGENLGDLIIHHGLIFLRKAMMIDSASPITPLFTWWFKEATRVNSFSEWIGLLAKVTINLVYGDCIFDTGQPELIGRSLE